MVRWSTRSRTPGRWTTCTCPTPTSLPDHASRPAAHLRRNRRTGRTPRSGTGAGRDTRPGQRGAHRPARPAVRQRYVLLRPATAAVRPRRAGRRSRPDLARPLRRRAGLVRDLGRDGARSTAAWPSGARSGMRTWSRSPPTSPTPPWPRSAPPAIAAWMSLTWRAGLQSGERVVVLGASGAVGQVALAVARHLDAASVVAVCRSAHSAGRGSGGRSDRGRGAEPGRGPGRTHGPADRGGRRTGGRGDRPGVRRTRRGGRDGPRTLGTAGQHRRGGPRRRRVLLRRAPRPHHRHPRLHQQRDHRRSSGPRP